MPLFDPLKELFDTGVRILTAAGVPDRAARSLVGKWRGQLKDDAKLLGLFTEAAKSHKVDLVAYLTRAIEQASEKRTGMFA